MPSRHPSVATGRADPEGTPQTSVTVPTIREKGSLLRVDRAIHLLDVENLCGTPAFNDQDLIALQRRYRELTPIGPEDLVVVASSHYRARELMFGWTDARPLFGSGPDGADKRLLDVIFHEGIEGRFAHIVIGSGDGIFSPACRHLEAYGPSITVVARPRRSLSRHISAVTGDIRLLEPVPESGAIGIPVFRK